MNGKPKLSDMDALALVLEYRQAVFTTTAANKNECLVREELLARLGSKDVEKQKDKSDG